MPLKITPDFSKDIKYFFIKTAGCIGILKDWLTRILGHALEQGLDTFDVAFADKYAIDNKGLRTIIEEALNGEIKMCNEPYEDIESLLINGLSDTATSEEPEVDNRRKPRKRKSRIGTRSPGRDKIGDQRHA